MGTLPKVVMVIVTAGFIPMMLWYANDVARDKQTPLWEKILLVTTYLVMLGTLIVACIAVVI